MACRPTDQAVPTAFISYSWDNTAHKTWTKNLAASLLGHGVKVTLDQWETAPGDQLPKFMETAIRENNYVVIICTPNYKKKSDNREGGVGYEGDIMTGEVLTDGNYRKFIPVLRSGTWGTSMPSWLKGKYSIDLSSDPYADEQYQDLLITLHNKREQAPPLGNAPPFRSSVRKEAKKFDPTKESADIEFEPIKIEGVLVDEVGRPRNDGTRGSALYAIPFKLNRAPTHEWGMLFLQTWENPPRWTSSHRRGIARVERDRIVLAGTTIEEVRDTHRATLKLVVDTVNSAIAEIVRKRRATEEAKAKQVQQQDEHIRKIADELDFGEAK